jgi:endonuclease YncB( thermonuclease family)
MRYNKPISITNSRLSAFTEFFRSIATKRNRRDLERDALSVPINPISNEYLNAVTYANTTKFTVPITFGKVVKVYDGDTITIASKLPNLDQPIYRFSVRLNGIDSPEIRGLTFAEKELAIIARNALHALIFGKIVTLRNVSTEKYGRILADVYLGDLHVNEWMIKEGYAIPYDGGTKTRPDEWN